MEQRFGSTWRQLELWWCGSSKPERARRWGLAGEMKEIASSVGREARRSGAGELRCQCWRRRHNKWVLTWLSDERSSDYQVAELSAAGDRWPAAGRDDNMAEQRRRTGWSRVAGGLVPKRRWRHICGRSCQCVQAAEGGGVAALGSYHGVDGG
jgi:hypothetical protein